MHHRPPIEFTFAGFSFPRALALLPNIGARRPSDRRAPTIERARHPNQNDGWGFYDSDDSGSKTFALRTELGDRSWTAEDSTFYPIIARLPKGRGFLAGWTMGSGMCGAFESGRHDSVNEAWFAANDAAHRIADMEAERYAEERAEHLELEAEPA